jgi:alditol oxidase
VRRMTPRPSHQPAQLRNWAGNIGFGAAGVLRPASVGELQDLVAGGARLQAIGAAHSFSAIADSPGYLVSTAGLPARVEIDDEQGTVTVSSGLRYADVAGPLHEAGRALANLASLPHISIAGAAATGTHGSGDTNGSLATVVAAIELVTADGELRTVRRTADADFDGMVVALGACGIVTALTLDTRPTFALRQYVYQDVPLAAVAGRFEEVMASGYSVSLFTDWTRPAFAQIWVKAADGQPRPADWLGGTLARRDLHPVPGQPPRHTTPQRGEPGPWHQRLPHFRPDFRPSAGAELQSEFLIAREHAVSALQELAALSAELATVTQVAEIRTVRGDSLWLSPAYERDSAAFHFTWVPDAAAVLPVLARVEAALAQFAARPHWGKLFTMSPVAVSALYPRMADFRRLVAGLDPDGKFGNRLVDEFARPDRLRA